MKTIRFLQTLIYYDGPQVVDAVDSEGGRYLGWARGPDGPENRFFAVATTLGQIEEVHEGRIEVLQELMSDPAAEWYLAEIGPGDDARMVPAPRARANKWAFDLP